MKLKPPVELNLTALELDTRPFVTVTIETIVPGATQLPLAKSVYVTVPPAVAVVPCRFAESWTEAPTVAVFDDRVVVITAVTGLTIRGSHGLVAMLLSESPL